jgi:ubiquinone/menaquinone biosynthesis C-methylase UbiE
LSVQRSNWDAFFSTLAPVAGERILDVGAGKGSIANHVLEASKGAEVYAVDPNGKRVASMQHNFPGVRSSVAGAENLPFSDSFFDKAYTTMALHHYADLGKALQEFRRVVKLGGCLVVVEVDPGSALGRMFRFFGRLNGEHTNLVTKDQLASRIEADGGFKVASSAKLKSSYIIRASRV